MAKYQNNSAYTHGMSAKLGILLVNLGSPDAPTPQAVRRYLAEFLSDPRMVELPKLLWQLILHGVILRVRPKQSAAGYQKVWLDEGSPLTVYSKRLADKCAQALANEEHILVRSAMRYGNPSIDNALQAFQNANVTKLIILPLFPQFSAVTSASVFDKLSESLTKRRWLPSLHFVRDYADFPGYIQAVSASISSFWQSNGRAQHLLFSYHGLPKRNLMLGDPYHCSCHKTTRLISENLTLAEDSFQTVFQSRFGKAEWLKPYCEETLVTLAKQGVKTVDIVCPGFATDCLETLEEIAIRYNESFIAAGGERVRYIPALNDANAQVSFILELLSQEVSQWFAPQATQEELQQQKERARLLGAHPQ